jgi:hypothetical protein
MTYAPLPLFEIVTEFDQQELIQFLESKGFDASNGQLEQIKSRWPTLEELRKALNSLKEFQVRDGTLDGRTTIEIIGKDDSWDAETIAVWLNIEILPQPEQSTVKFHFPQGGWHEIERPFMNALARICGPYIVMYESWGLEDFSWYVG